MTDDTNELRYNLQNPSDTGARYPFSESGMV